MLGTQQDLCWHSGGDGSLIAVSIVYSVRRRISEKTIDSALEEYCIKEEQRKWGSSQREMWNQGRVILFYFVLFFKFADIAVCSSID